MPISTQVLNKYKNDIFVETGTESGDGVFRALECGFKDIYSIEIRDDYYLKSSERFKNNKNVHLYRGDSILILPQILSLVKGNATFWLDAHVIGRRDKILGKKSCPILEEIEVIMKNHQFNKILLIDDMRLFRGMGKGMWGNILDKDILKTIALYGEYKINYENGYRQNDIMAVDIKII